MKYRRNQTGREVSLPGRTERAPALQGIIVAHHGIAVEVLFEDGQRRTVRVKRNSGHVVGDDVVVSDETLKQMPRRTELRRRDARGGVHLVAANLDVLGIVVAPRAPTGFIDRAIVAARAAGLRPFLVVNKCDLPETEPLLQTMTATYAGSVAVFPVSAVSGAGLKALEGFFGGESLRGAFVGTTGVGKSSLLNSLCPDITLKVGDTSDYRGMGRHTTTVATLHQLSGGGELVDTPGFRDFGLVAITAEDLALHFPGFEEHGQTACRFRNCRHRSEPGCSIVELVERKTIQHQRYLTYLEMLEEVEAEQDDSRTRGWR